MARTPGKRRGITLSARAESAASIKQLGAQVAAPDHPASRPAPPAPGPIPDHSGTAPEALLGQLDELRRLGAELESRWRHQVEQMQGQELQLQQQRDQIAAQAKQLHTIAETRRTAGRLGVLLSLLTLATIAALGFHTWPRLQDVAGDVNRVGMGVGELAPQLDTVRGNFATLASDLERMGGTVASLRQDVSGVRSDLGSLRQAVANLPTNQAPVQADAGGRRGAAALPRGATTMTNPYRMMRPGIPR